jgi:hypothetical protein
LLQMVIIMLAKYPISQDSKNGKLYGHLDCSTRKATERLMSSKARSVATP